MERRQPLSRPRRKGFAAPVALTLLGVGLIQYALIQPLRPLPTPALRQVALAASARGLTNYVTGRQNSVLEEKALAAEYAAVQPTWTQEGFAERADKVATALAQVPTGRGGPEEAPTGEAVAASVATAKTAAPTAIPPRTEVMVYTVESGDNPWSISQRFGISQDTLIWANSDLELDPDLIQIGDKLTILPVTGVWHTVSNGETLQSIAARYQVDVKAIAGYAPNGITDATKLTAGMKLIIPDGIRPFEPHIVYTNSGAVTVNARSEPGQFIWPASGVITTIFQAGHHAIDIANNQGVPIYAAASGTVTIADYRGGMGNMVHIVHAGGWESEYGHMVKLLVVPGQEVLQGQQIGLMGTTGNSTGPHLHFILTLYSGAVNPVRYLP